MDFLRAVTQKGGWLRVTPVRAIVLEYIVGSEAASSASGLRDRSINYGSWRMGKPFERPNRGGAGRERASAGGAGCRVPRAQMPCSASPFKIEKWTKFTNFAKFVKFPYMIFLDVENIGKNV